MFNDEYSLELYKIVREDEDMYYRDFVDFIAKTKVSKAIYHGEPIPMTYQGLFYNKKNRSDFVYISNILMSMTDKITKEFVENPEYRKIFQLDPAIEELVLHDLGYDVPVPICRYDVFYDGVNYMLCELNTDGSSAMNEDNTLGQLLLQTKAMQKFMEKHDVENVDMFTPWVWETTDMYKKYVSDKKPNVAIVDNLEVGTPNEFDEFKRVYEENGFNCEIIDIRDLEYKNGKLCHGDYVIDLVYRRIVTLELLKIKDQIKPFLDAYMDNAFFMVGSFRSQLMHSKLIFEIFRDEQTQALLNNEEKKFIDEHVPFTKKIEERDAYEIIMNKDKYIFKPIDGYASLGIYVGSEMREEELQEKLPEFIRIGYVFQEYYDMNKCEFLEFEEKSPVLNKFTQVVGLFIYNKHFVAPYTRIGKDNVVSGARKYYTAPNLFINE